MPEGHTLHRLARDLGAAYAGRRLAISSPQGRFAESAALVDGAVLEDADAWGKHLFLRFDNGRVVHVHLGLYGRFTTSHGEDVAEPRGQVRMRLVAAPDADHDEPTWSDLRGATACELLEEPQVADLLDRLGPDPLRADADPDRAWARISRSRAPIATLLMDQKVVAGIGNVYRAEVLFRQRVDPFREGRTLRRATWQALWDDTVGLMEAGVRAGRIRTLRPEDAAAAKGARAAADEAAGAVEGGRGRRRRGGQVYVYRRAGEPCLLCGTVVRTQEIAARNLFWCPRCQRRFVSRSLR